MILYQGIEMIEHFRIKRSGLNKMVLIVKPSNENDLEQGTSVRCGLSIFGLSKRFPMHVMVVSN